MPPLPDYPSLEDLHAHARTLLQAAGARDAHALDRVGPFHGDPAAINLQQAQSVIAREHGFSGWEALKHHIQTGGSAHQTLDQLATRFLDLACLAYRTDVDATPARFDAASELLAAHPEIADHSIHVAAALGDGAGIDRWLAHDPGLLNARGGFYAWEPLMYAAYARVPGRSSLPAARRLIAHGADPDAHIMWGEQYRFTALTGVFGEGEGGPVNFPEHPDMETFARLLLRAGAHPNDAQACYNRCFTPDNRVFRILLQHGLSPDHPNNWLDTDLTTPHPSRTMHFHLILAIRWGFLDRADLLIDHGVDVNAPDDGYQTMTRGLGPYRSAMNRGQTRIAARLLAAGAVRDDPVGAERLQAACMSGDLARARSLLADDPGMMDRIAPHRAEMLDEAARSQNLAALHTMAELGFPLTPKDRAGPLHTAAFHGRIEALRLLIAAGADPAQRDPVYASAPLGHALHAGQTAAIAFLDTQHMDIFAAAARGRADLIQAAARKTPDSINQPFGTVRPDTAGPGPMDWATPLWFAVQNRRADMVRLLLDLGADPNAPAGSAGTIRNLVQTLDDPGLTALIPAIGP